MSRGNLDTGSPPATLTVVSSVRSSAVPGYMPRPPMVPEMVMEDMRTGEIERADEAFVDNPDEMRDDPAWSGRGAWLVILLGVLGIAALALLLHLLAGL